MSGQNTSRRNFLGAAAAAPALGSATLADPGRAAAQAAGIRRGDLPDLTIKQVKVLVLKADASAGLPPCPALLGRSGGRPGREVRLHRHQQRHRGQLHPRRSLLPSQLEQPRLARIRQEHPARQERPRPARPHLAVGARACAARASSPTPPPSTTAAGTSSARPSTCPSTASSEPIATSVMRLRQLAASADRRRFRRRRQALPSRRLHGLQDPSARRHRSRLGTTTSSTWRSSKPSARPAGDDMPLLYDPVGV